MLAGVGAIVGFALVGGDDTKAPQASANEPAPAKDPEPASEEAGGNTEASQPSTEQDLGIGDSIEAEGVEATLNGVRILPTTDLDQPIENPDNRFLAADLTFENVSDEAVSVSSLLEFVLKNEEGYSASQTVHTQQKGLAEGEIAPDEKASGEIVYEVPPESRGLQLDYKPFASGGTYTWTIGDAQGIATAPQPEEATSPTPEPTTAASPASETEVAGAAEDYYQAVDREDWAYTYANLDAATRALYPEDEWYLKNQYFADTEGLKLSTIDVVVENSTSDPEVGVTVYRTFKDGTSINRYTLFVQEDGAWKHRFTEEENAIFEPGVPYEEFVAGSSASATADSSASAAADGDINCDEVSQAQAQAILESDGSDPNDLDGDDNGTACDG
ncbi:DUF4352 domain-containing protein [Rubrobacter tropicus]|uniref:DUF4352 domain-containing protein n=1 Tax=Rubrobacter tropicus TaxID=2653851 RepID=UPI00140D4B1D|nr:DUF4352 domain-containing protein [Rubrobacter tropicus]